MKIRPTPEIVAGLVFLGTIIYALIAIPLALTGAPWWAFLVWWVFSYGAAVAVWLIR